MFAWAQWLSWVYDKAMPDNWRASSQLAGWRSTAALYARTLGAHPRADLTVRTFPDGNHNLHRSPTGGLREMIGMPERRAVEGDYETMAGWLEEKVGAG
ncbi:MAG: hypothetical protein ACK5U9_11840 [Brevundimonas sp.]|jgi:hypothetical protein|uniref:hypothetical protein n=1 Tax=Brevundimonas sp. TaxID=1871086 RepID=UPI00391A2301